MNTSNLILFSAVGALAGFGLSAVGYFLYRKSILADAKEDADEITAEAKARFEEEEKERQLIKEEIELEAWSKVEESHLDIEERIQEIEEEIKSRKIKYEEQDKGLRQGLLAEETELRNLSIRLAELEKKHQTLIDQLKQTRSDYQKELIQRTQAEEQDVIDQIKDQLVSDAHARAEKLAEENVTEAKEFAEAKAKRILALCIDRFSKEMSTERHIASTFFPNERVREIFCKQLKENCTAIREATGCDVFIDENPVPERLFNVQVVGYDPVRRELTRRLFERIFNDIEKRNKTPNPEMIKIAAENIRNELLKQIKKDGDQLSKELGFVDLNPEIKQVMGSLRYRYSYTQNQYFHCGEVGWFAGLLMSELVGAKSIEFKQKESISKAAAKFARRSGYLHDLGKALDHEMDGSHAVIGADFIQARGEHEDIVHAVRAHHYDVQPAADMDFLVIAADAISGGRPGARRSTMETYTQKVTGLQEISKRFQGVTDVFVLNGGRECRVHVNSRQVDDLGALKISQQIAKTIEDEMQYPGQIKVVVVRETIAIENRPGKDGGREFRR